MNFKVEKFIPDKQGRFIILKLSLEEKAIVLVNIYAPNDVAQQVSFFKRLYQQLEEFAQDTIVIGGDFNCALTPNDKRGGNPVSKKAAVIQEINTLCDLYNLSDIWRILNNDKQCFTWRTKSFKIQCRLDLFLVSQELIQLAKKCDIIHTPESDVYKTTISPILDYDCIVWGFCTKKNSDFLERLQNEAMSTQSMRERLGLLTIFNRCHYLRLQLEYKIVNDYHCVR